MWIAPIAEPEAAALRDRCEQWAAGQDMDALARERPSLPDCLVNRAAEVWWALLVLAELAGGDWPKRAARAAEALTAGARRPRSAPVGLLGGTEAGARSPRAQPQQDLPLSVPHESISDRRGTRGRAPFARE
jgi:hypothetical protein